MIAFSCSQCGMKFQVKPEFAGRSTRCPTCKHALVVPREEVTQAFVPGGQIDGTKSSLAQVGLAGGVTLGQANAARPGQTPVHAVLARRGPASQRYLLEGEIARGGMGAVLRAVDCDIRREVAVKFLLDQSDARKQLRFVEEAQITGQLEHPNIVPIHELGVDAQGRLFFAMKMVRGRSLKDILDEHRQSPKTAEKEFPLPRLLTVFVGVCNALAYAHARGVVHRDLKPANVMLGDFGEVYLMDWGLAKVATGDEPAAPPTTAPAAATVSGGGRSDARPAPVVTSRTEEADLTQDGALLGTPVYMAPEQAAGRLNEVGPRSDVYALGALLYELLTLRPPVEPEGGFPSIIWRVMEGLVEPPERRAPERARAGRIPRELSAVALKALAKRPEDRYPDVASLRRDIERYQEGRGVSAREDTTREMLWRLVKRNKAVSAATLLFLPLLVVKLGLTAVNYRAYARELQAREEQTLLAVPAFVQSARLLAGDGDLDKGLEQVNLALTYDPANPDGRLLKGQVLVVKKDWTAGRTELGRYLELRPDDAGAKNLAGLCVPGREHEMQTLLALAEELQRQKATSLAARLLREVGTLVQARRSLLKLYQTQIEVAWPGRGQLVKLTPDGRFSLSISAFEQLADLRPLHGMLLESLSLDGCPNLTDLSPLQGMPLAVLSLKNCPRVRDLSPLRDMPLDVLVLYTCSVSDLSPLRDRPLTRLELYYCSDLKDLTPLQGLPLTRLVVASCPVHDLTPLRHLPLTYLTLGTCTLVNDLTPLRGLPLSYLSLDHCVLVKDVTPLRGMPLKYLTLHATGVTDLTPLHGLPLTTLVLTQCYQVKDVTPLQGMSLSEIHLEPRLVTKGVEGLRAMKSLRRISTGAGHFSPEEFWKKYGNRSSSAAA